MLWNYIIRPDKKGDEQMIEELSQELTMLRERLDEIGGHL
jgi:hypothetical protein